MIESAYTIIITTFVSHRETEELVVAGHLWMDASSAVAGHFRSGSSPTLAVSPRG